MTDLDEEIAIMEVRLRKLKEARKIREQLKWQRQVLYQTRLPKTRRLFNWFISLLRKKSFLLTLIILYVLGVLLLCLVLLIGGIF